MFEEDLEELEDSFEEEELNQSDSDDFGDDLIPNRANLLKRRIGETSEETE
jgi:hypothetical protein